MAIPTLNLTTITLTQGERNALNKAIIIGLASQSVGFGPEDLESEMFDFSQAEFAALQTAQAKLSPAGSLLFIAP